MKSKIINNYNINAFTSKKEFLDQIMHSKKILVAMNAEKIIKKDNDLINIVNNNIGYADGIGAVIALRLNGLSAVKIAGSEFWLDIVKRFKTSKTFYLVGSSTEVIESTVKKLKKEHPEINIIGYRNGFLNQEDKKQLLQTIKEKKPDVVFVAQGTPRQEFLMNDLIKEHPAIYMGLGGSFDIYGGQKKRAPQFFLKLELEWLYRLFKEPTRIGRQLSLVKFIAMLASNSLFAPKKRVAF